MRKPRLKWSRVSYAPAYASQTIKPRRTTDQWSFEDPTRIGSTGMFVNGHRNSPFGRRITSYTAELHVNGSPVWKPQEKFETLRVAQLRVEAELRRRLREMIALTFKIERT